ncbi:MAG: sugar nucleotide-binding protein, partial [Gammaproteobacteria bacterium]|nr:sugar nucleotide-binding protein [Gammaproteobacteria bacterium]
IFTRARALGLLERTPELRAIPTKDYPTPAQRPLHSILAPSDEFQTGLGGLEDWRNALDRTLSRLAQGLE